MSIVVSALTKIYGRQKAVDHISFQAQPGQIVGFLGPNGAGKSTTMKMLTGYLSPTRGHAKVCGFDVVQQSMDVRRSIGYLPEHNPLYLDMYVKEYLQFIGSLHGLKGGRLGERIADMVERVGLTREQNKKIGALSKGYRQRVGLAQALIHDPQVLILDEPTTGLDPNQIVEIRQVIKDAGRDKTVIFSTHIMQEVEALCDRVVIINLGRIVADSTLAELRARQENARGLLLVEFEKDVNIRALSTIPGVKEVRPKGQGKYQFVTDGRPDVRIAIFQLAAQREWTLIGLRQEESNLEKIFQQLTRDDAAPAQAPPNAPEGDIPS